jgi:2-hydroxychromene-2-carboxylate isomerase
MAARPTVDFWYDFASTYSYLTAMRIEALAQEAKLTIRWRPFLLGPIFAAQGWTSSPFNLYPVKGRYMWRDMERLCARDGLPLRRPDPFPQNSLHAARLALAGREAGWTGAFTTALYHAEFAEGRSISEEAVLRGVLKQVGADPDQALAMARSEEIQGRLKAETELAKSLGIFGAPTFITPDGELFWGNDRLEDALAWTAERA